MISPWWCFARGAGTVTFLGYAVIGVLAFVFVQALVTETKGRSLEQIETDLREKASFASG